MTHEQLVVAFSRRRDDVSKQAYLVGVIATVVVAVTAPSLGDAASVPALMLVGTAGVRRCGDKQTSNSVKSAVKQLKAAGAKQVLNKYLF